MRHKDQPFLLYLAFNAVHTPMHATDSRLQRFATISDPRRKTYAAMLAAMDEAVGTVLEALRSAHLEENTLIFFLSDNGGPTMRGTTINGSRNDPLRGSKRTTLEGGIHVPFVVQWKGKLPAGSVYDTPVIQLDILPTALAAAGVAVSPEWKLDGVDLSPRPAGKRRRLRTKHSSGAWANRRPSGRVTGSWFATTKPRTPRARARVPSTRGCRMSVSTTWLKTWESVTILPVRIRRGSRNYGRPGRRGTKSLPGRYGGQEARRRRPGGAAR